LHASASRLSQAGGRCQATKAQRDARQVRSNSTIISSVLGCCAAPLLRRQSADDTA
jgi:hypothetical protein